MKYYKDKKYFYVYLLVLPETGEFYYGSRGCNVEPSKDNYKGSMNTWKPDKSILVKTIIKSDFKTRDEAILFEASLIKENINNPLIRNYYIPHIGFYNVGNVIVKDKDNNIFHVALSDERYISGELVSVNKGKVITKDCNGNVFIVDKSDSRYLSGELKFYFCDKITVKDKSGNTFSIDKNDSRYLSGELVGINKNKVIVKDIHENVFEVSKDNPKYLSGELVGINKNKASVIDLSGNTFQIDINDDKYLNQNIVGVNKGMIVTKDKDGNKLRVSITDERYMSGELVGVSKGNKLSQEHKNKISEKCKGNKASTGLIHVTNEFENKLIKPELIDDFIKKGWKRGRTLKNNKTKM